MSMAFSLPVDGDGKLVPINPSTLGIKRRGVTNEDHVTYNFGPDGSGCTRKFSCLWDERFSAVVYWVGAVKMWLDSGNPKISRLVPQKDPDFSKWICTKCEIVGYRFTGNIESREEGSEPLPEHERADLVCTYELVPYDVKTDELTTDESERYVTKPGFPGADVSTETNYIGLPGGTLQYTIDGGDAGTKPQGVPIPFAVGFVEPGRKCKIIWKRLPRDAWGPGTILFDRIIGVDGTSRGYLGALNKTTFEGRWSLTQQLVGVEERLLPDPTGLDYSWDIGYLISDKPVPYGHLGLYYHATDGTGAGYYQVLRPTAATFGTIDDPADIGDEDAMFIVREFDDLFVAGSV